MEEGNLKNNIKFYYKSFSPKKLELFNPSKTLGEELKLQRNYYDLVKVPKTTTINKATKLTNFLKSVKGEQILNKLDDTNSLEEYLKKNFSYADIIGSGSPARISELENEINSKLDKFNMDNYFTSYYFLFTLYGFLDFNSLLKLLGRYNVKYRYSSAKIQQLPKCFKAEFSMFKKNMGGYNFYSLVKPYLKYLNVQEKVELSLTIGEPSYFIEELLDNKITTITYGTAKKLIQIIGIKFTNGHTVDDLLYSFGMLNDEDVVKEREIEEYLDELEFERQQEQNNLIPINFNYIYKNNDVEQFTFLNDLKEMLSDVNNNFQNFITESCNKYDIDSILNAYKVLTTLKEMSTNILNSSKLLSLPLNQDVDKVVKYYEENISKRYFDRPVNITLLDDITTSEDEKIESLNVCIPKLIIDVKENSDKYNFRNYFKEIYSKDMFKNF